MALTYVCEILRILGVFGAVVDILKVQCSGGCVQTAVQGSGIEK